MKKLANYFVFLSFTILTVAASKPIIAGGCNNHMNKTSKIECPEDDTKCQTEKAEKSFSKEIIKS